MTPYYQDKWVTIYHDTHATIYCGHVLDILRQMPDESVDCIVTSPPYWGLRHYRTEPVIWGGDRLCEHDWQPEDKFLDSFCNRCSAWKGELGLEPTPDLYIAHLMEIFNELKRVLKRTGTCWVNIDDTYAGSGSGTNDYKTPASRSINKTDVMFTKTPPQQKVDLPLKTLCAIPERFMLAMLESGWILRNRIIWYKPNPMPESVKDRFTSSWEYLLFFVKSKRYWFEQQFEPHLTGWVATSSLNPNSNSTYYDNLDAFVGKPYFRRDRKPAQVNIMGRNKRDVWEIPTEPCPVRGVHFAAYPEKLCETPILAGCPPMICRKCGKARVKSYEPAGEYLTFRQRASNEDWYPRAEHDGYGQSCMVPPMFRDKGYSDCGCNAGWEAGTVLDPFCGTGTTLAIAKKLGRKAIGIDISPKYCQVATERLQAIPIPMELEDEL